ncbi:tetrapyrrole methylase family protein / MazG family protein [Niallia circulans]|uniref:nucleoside triphosphate pyrophosphohydrolase n=1 Tax=Niallia circulans TaxID=1397 RepID=UPI00077C5C31|nr:nucleoside triphosphate pyrophosphohydrolase [Niallia circulans]MDR4318922.1 nucleoside triphosphate pyrophosphohydrolase [Niallia circulans]MED3839684.1 nucleoside triphosphate pyrophosphohydrolase [Niallia circulans]MED4245476.1 nucleoside triphosphate pyrophosphohydrolase [Niallia circulans]MED4250405.1 nucleoside triphosphate pyrophosphohydrolase [Niallia circulans]QKH59357.1 nucleoside triphosphate pyrophosphohydrolase [Niallia circulans]
MSQIKIIGLGAGDIDQLSLGVYRSLIDDNKTVYVRTKDHPVISTLKQEGITFYSFDSIYEKHNQFEAVYEEIVEFLLEKAKEMDIVYAVPGHPLVAEKTVQLLIEKDKEGIASIEIAGGQSFLDSIFQALRIDPIEGFQLLDGTALNRASIQLRNHLIIGQVYDTFSASEVKLTLMDMLPYDYPIKIVTAAGSSLEKIKEIELHELDREVDLNNLTSIYVPPVQEEKFLYKEFSQLRQIIAELRGPNGCPWDKKQTHESLRKYLLEESYELIEAINEGDIDHIIEELGDVLLQVMLHSQIGEDEGYFSIDDVLEGISDKMIRRHPHVFGEEQADSVDDVMKHWQNAKKQEAKTDRESVLEGINSALPNLMQAYELQKRAAKIGFDWPNVEGAWEKVKEEILEFQEELKEVNNNEQIESEFGDILFSLVNIARFYKVDPELAIFRTNKKFIQRFSYIEERVKESGKEWSQMNLEELDQFWNEAKKK